MTGGIKVGFVSFRNLAAPVALCAVLILLKKKFSLPEEFYQLFPIRFISKTQNVVENAAGLKLACSLFLFAALFFTLTPCLYYAQFNPRSFDTAVYVKPLWSTLHDSFMATSVRPYAFHAWGDHFNPLLLFFLPFYYVWQDPRMVLILQGLVVALGVFPLFWLSQEKTKSKTLSVLIALAYVSSTSLRHLTANTFHPETVAITFLLFAFFFLEKKRIGLTLLFLFLLAICKENMWGVVAFFGIFMALKYRYVKTGLSLFVVGLSMFVVCLKYIVPHFSFTHDYSYVPRYAHLGSSFGDIFLNLIHKPWLILQSFGIGMWKKITFLKSIFLVSGGFSLFSPLHLIVSFPLLAQSLLSNYWGEFSTASQAILIPLGSALIAVPYGISFLLSEPRISKYISVKKLAVWLLFTIFVFMEFSPILTLRKSQNLNFDAVIAKKIVDFLPREKSVTSTVAIFEHLLDRKESFLYGDVQQTNTQYVVLAKGNEFPSEQSLNDALAELTKRNYHIVLQGKNIYLLYKSES